MSENQYLPRRKEREGATVATSPLKHLKQLLAGDRLEHLSAVSLSIDLNLKKNSAQGQDGVQLAIKYTNNTVSKNKNYKTLKNILTS